MIRAPCPGRRLCRFVASLFLLLLSGNAAAIDEIRLDWGDIAADGWRAQGVSLALTLPADTASTLNITITQLEIGTYRVQQLRLLCVDFELLPQSVACRNGQLSLRSDDLELDAVPAHFSYRLDTRELDVTLSDVRLAGGRLTLRLQQQNAGWRLAATLAGTRLAGIAALAQKTGLKLPALDLQGYLEGQLGLRGDSTGLNNIDWQLRTRAAGYSNAEGSQAAEALQLVSSGKATPAGPDWQVQATLAARQGMLYADPLYLEFSAAQPLQLSTKLDWKAATRELQVQSLEFDQPGVVSGSLAAQLMTAAQQPLQQLTLDIREASFPGFYSNWVQPWLVGSPLEKLDSEGRLRGHVVLREGRPEQVSLTLEDVSLREQAGLFELRGLDGALRWSNNDTPQQSSLAWQGASLYRLQFGATRLALQSDSRGVQLTQPLVVPLLDGKLYVEQFELGVDDAGAMRWLLDGFLTPVSMQAFSTALGWPELSGTLSGMVPKMRYEKGELTLGGTLLVQAFDGDITLRNLRIEQPLGRVPRLWTDIRLDHLDLKTLTRTFSFGRIEGRLQGRVDGLYMEAWQLVAFDALFETPPDDDSRHRISQKAVDNISNLGGAGLGGALSRSFLRFLEDFPYRRLGISCRLENGVCQMGGVAPAEHGYYLVQGRVLPPRLDVVGYADAVDWQSLVDRLTAITSGETPRVE